MNYTLTAARAAFGLSGKAAGLFSGPVTFARFFVSGTPAALRYARVGVAAPGSFSLTGGTSVGARTVGAAAGSFSVAGVAASLEVSHLLTALDDSFSVAEIDARLLWRHRLVADVAAFTLAGVAAGSIYRKSLRAETGAAVLAGNHAFFVPRLFPIAGGSVAFSAFDAELTWDRSQKVLRTSDLLWPEDVLGCPLLSSYEGTVGAMFDRSSLFTNASKYAKARNEERRSYAVEFLWTHAQLDAFETFLADTLNGGMRWFSMRHLANGIMRPLVTHIETPPVIVPQADRPGLVRVSFAVTVFWRVALPPVWA